MYRVRKKFASLRTKEAAYEEAQAALPETASRAQLDRADLDENATRAQLRRAGLPLGPTKRQARKVARLFAAAQRQYNSWRETGLNLARAKREAIGRLQEEIAALQVRQERRQAVKRARAIRARETKIAAHERDLDELPRDLPHFREIEVGMEAHDNRQGLYRYRVYGLAPNEHPPYDSEVFGRVLAEYIAQGVNLQGESLRVVTLSGGLDPLGQMRYATIINNEIMTRFKNGELTQQDLAEYLGDRIDRLEIGDAVGSDAADPGFVIDYDSFRLTWRVPQDVGSRKRGRFQATNTVAVERVEGFELIDFSRAGNDDCLIAQLKAAAKQLTEKAPKQQARSVRAKLNLPMTGPLSVIEHLPALADYYGLFVRVIRGWTVKTFEEREFDRHGICLTDPIPDVLTEAGYPGCPLLELYIDEAGGHITVINRMNAGEVQMDRRNGELGFEDDEVGKLVEARVVGKFGKILPLANDHVDCDQDPQDDEPCINPPLIIGFDYETVGNRRMKVVPYGLAWANYGSPTETTRMIEDGGVQRKVTEYGLDEDCRELAVRRVWSDNPGVYDPTEEFMKYLLDLNRPVILVAFNNSRFDNGILAETAVKWRMVVDIFRANGEYKKLCLAGKIITLDLAKMVPGNSLAKACEGFQTLPTKVEGFNHSYPQMAFDEGRFAEWLAEYQVHADKYLEGDIRCMGSLLAKVAKTQSAMVGIKLSDWFAKQTAAGLAWDYVTRNCYVPPPCFYESQDLFVRDCATAGRTQLLGKKPLRVVDKQAVMDFSSQYPAVMAAAENMDSLFDPLWLWGCFPSSFGLEPDFSDECEAIMLKNGIGCIYGGLAYLMEKYQVGDMEALIAHVAGMEAGPEKKIAQDRIDGYLKSGTVFLRNFAREHELHSVAEMRAWCENCKKGEHKLLKKKVKKYLNFGKNDFSKIEIQYRKSFAARPSWVREYVPGVIGYYKVRIYNQGESVYKLLAKRAEGEPLDWECGDPFDGHASHLEIEMLRAAGAEFEVLYGLTFERMKPMKGLFRYIVENVYAIKAEQDRLLAEDKKHKDEPGYIPKGNPALRLVCKIIINSISGKPLQRNFKTRTFLCATVKACIKAEMQLDPDKGIEPIPLGCGYTLVSGTLRCSTYSSIHSMPSIIGALTYSYARAALFKAVLCHAPMPGVMPTAENLTVRVIYGDTDSAMIIGQQSIDNLRAIHGDVFFSDIPGKEREKRLGDLENELTDDCDRHLGLYIRTKQYSIFGIENATNALLDSKIRAKGVRRRDLIIPWRFVQQYPRTMAMLERRVKYDMPFCTKLMMDGLITILDKIEDPTENRRHVLPFFDNHPTSYFQAAYDAYVDSSRVSYTLGMQFVRYWNHTGQRTLQLLRLKRIGAKTFAPSMEFEIDEDPVELEEPEIPNRAFGEVVPIHDPIEPTSMESEQKKTAKKGPKREKKDAVHKALDKFEKLEVEAPKIEEYVIDEGYEEPRCVYKLRDEPFAENALTNEGSYTIRDEELRRFLLFKSYQHFRVWLETRPEQRCHHEVIPGQFAQKLKFDLDIAKEKLVPLYSVWVNKPDNFVELCEQNGLRGTNVDFDGIAKLILAVTINAIIDQLYGPLYCAKKLKFDSKNIVLTDSSGESGESYKYSWHIVVAGYAVKNCQEAAAWTELIVSTMPEIFRQFIDLNVNSSLQNFRMVGSTKNGRCKRPAAALSAELKIQENAKLSDYHVRAVDDCHLIPSILGEKRPKKGAKKDNDVRYEKHLPAIERSGLLTNHRFKRVDGNMIRFDRISPSYCPICERVHEHDNTMSVLVGKTGALYEICRRAKGKRALTVQAQ